MISKYFLLFFLFCVPYTVIGVKLQIEDAVAKTEISSGDRAHLEISDPVQYSHQQSHTKFTIQDIIERRDEEKQRTLPWWKAYFPLYFSASLVLLALVLFILWCRHTEERYGPMTIPVDAEGRPFVYSKYGRRSVSEVQNIAIAPDAPFLPSRRYSKSSCNTGPKLVPLKCSKPACVCAQPETGRGGGNGGGGRGKANRWNRRKAEEPEVYAPASN